MNLIKKIGWPVLLKIICKNVNPSILANCSLLKINAVKTFINATHVLIKY